MTMLERLRKRQRVPDYSDLTKLTAPVNRQQRRQPSSEIRAAVKSVQAIGAAFAMTGEKAEQALQQFARDLGVAASTIPKNKGRRNR